MCWQVQLVISYIIVITSPYFFVVVFCLFIFLFFFQTGQVLHGHSSSISESEEFKKAVQKVGDIHLTIIQ